MTTPPEVLALLDPTLRPGWYSLDVGRSGVVLRCADADGAVAATTTLRQLCGPDAYRTAPGSLGEPLLVPAVEVTDGPRTAWRGVLLDVARHFLPKADLLRFVDLVAMHKLNVLHLHLTDDQGWRVEIRSWPELTRRGAWRTESNVGSWRHDQFDGRPHGGFYSQQDLAEVVAYAAQRGVTVVPEIDVPGHVQAALAAYPELGVEAEPVPVRTSWGVSDHVLAPTPRSLDFVTQVLDEVLEVFDSPWVCLGGDEVPTARWRASPAVARWADELGLSDVSELHGWFVGALCRHVLARGRTPVVWDEALGPQLPAGTAVLSWRGVSAGLDAMAAGHDVVMAPEQVLYLDHRASDHPDEPVPVGFVRTVEDVYAFDPLPPEALAAHAEGEGDGGGDGEDAATPTVTGPHGTSGPSRAGTLLGAQAQLWTEHLDSARRLDYAAFPRLAAFAEAVWSPAEDRSPGSAASREFLGRLAAAHLPRLTAAGVEYRPLDGPLPWQQRPGVEGWARDLTSELAAAGWRGAGGWHDDTGESR